MPHLRNSAAVSILVIAKLDDQVEAINAALRDAGQAVHCHKVDKPADLEACFLKHKPLLIAVFENASKTNLGSAVATMAPVEPHVPIILITNDVSEESIAGAMTLGARDAVSLGNIVRLQTVALRELRACQNELSLRKLMNSASQFKHELHALKQVSVDAIADIQEGIIVNANPAWAELFGLPVDTDLTGLPIMDLCTPSDRPELKVALLACQRGKSTEAELRVNGVRTDGQDFPVAFKLESITHDGEKAVRVLVTPPPKQQLTPTGLIEKALQRDPVTGLFNQQHFIGVATERLQRAPSGGVRAFAFIRPDRFSQARTDLGLVGAETIISQFGQIVREFMQPGDIYGRIGGTLFAMLIERGTMEDAESWAERLRQTVAHTVFEYANRSTAITCSIGLCEVESTSVDIEKLLTESEAACSKSRQSGGNRTILSVSSGAAKKIRQDDNIWAPRIRSALMENRLRLEHQPVASLNNDIDGAFDTLVRMLDNEGNTILPSEFIPAAERTGLIKNIDRWVIGASLSFCASGKAKLVLVRISRDSLLDETLLIWLRAHIAEYAVETSRICFEISEELAVQHMRQTLDLANALRSSGFKFAIEHFGKAVNSAAVIGRIPMDYLKLDGSLMQGLHRNTEAQNKVREYARLAIEHGVYTIAERVQDANTMAVLWQLGVAFIQGNYVQSSEIVIEDTSQTSSTIRTLSIATSQQRKLETQLQ